MSNSNAKVTGIGGIFFKARDPARISAWYQQHLGVPIKDGHAEFFWRAHDRPEQEGRTVWSVFPADTDYFGPGQGGFMINYQVANLERLLLELRRDGIVVEKVEEFDYGRFAWITDPEGNRVELWEAKSA
jgi:predicted enzyme related to lactoylglutathione lyase